MTLSLGLLRSGLLNRRINQPANQVLRLHLAFSSASPSPSDPSAAAAGPQTTIREGKVEIFLDESNSVFYNKTQVCVLRIFTFHFLGRFMFFEFLHSIF
jgi:tRNA (guanine26-N2/guanine27-N2)-dimethyltransferase